MSAPKFAHLHVHSEFSLLDGLGKFKDYISICKEHEMPAMALTDHGNMFGTYRFFEKFTSAGVKPIIGVEAYLAPGSRFDKRGKVDKEYNHLLLLAENKKGYENLMKIVTRGYTEGFYYKPRVDKDLLYEFREGIICLSGCLSAELSDRFFNNPDQVAQTISDYQAIFGKDNYFLELQDHQNIEEQRQLNKFLIDLSKKEGIPMVITKDTHYAKKEDNEVQDALVCIQTGRFITEEKRMSMMDEDFSLVPPEEIWSRWSHLPELFENTVKIADRCEVDLTNKSWIFPEPGFPEQFSSYSEYLREEVYRNAREKYGDPLDQSIIDRIEYELGVIIGKGFDKYTILVKDFVDFMESKDIPTNTRGSAAGSIVSYCLGITSVDPIMFKLPFERYLNPLRPKAPDIDLDIADTSRDEVIKYAVEKYGDDSVAHIITFGKMLTRGAIRDVGRVLGYPYAQVDKIAKMIPTLAPAAVQALPGGGMSIQNAIDLSSELREAYENDPDTKKILDMAREIEGTARHASLHAAGILITPKPIDHYVPVYADSNGVRATQFEMGELETLGLQKMDFLGLRNLSTMATAFKYIEERHGIKYTRKNIPLDSTKTYEMLSRGETFGVFQLEGGAMTKSLVKLRPTNIFDIAAMVALYRPGPMNFIDEYIHNKNNPDQIKYYDDRFKKILEDSYGLIVYQDDVLFITIDIAGYDWKEADVFRKAMGKKKPEVMREQKEKLAKGLKENGGLNDEQVEELWHKIETFAGYGFNKAHAAAYGTLAYQIAFLKANYPAEFMASLLDGEIGNYENTGLNVKEAQRMGIKVLGADINQSNKSFTIIDDQTIRFGLWAIKNVGEAIVEKIVEERERGGAFKDFQDFATRVDESVLNKKSLESLARAGAFDSIEPNRKKLVENLETIQNFAKAQKSSTEGLFSDEKPVLKLKNVQDYTNLEKAFFERELLGLFLTNHPLEEFKDTIKQYELLTADDLKSDDLGKIMFVAGVVGTTEKKLTKTKSHIGIVEIEGFTRQMESTIFPGKFEDLYPKMKTGQIFVFKGRIESDTFNQPEDTEEGGEVAKFKMLLEEVVDISEVESIKKLNSRSDKPRDFTGKNGKSGKFPGGYNGEKKNGVKPKRGGDFSKDSSTLSSGNGSDSSKILNSTVSTTKYSAETQSCSSGSTPAIKNDSSQNPSDCAYDSSDNASYDSANTTKSKDLTMQELEKFLYKNLQIKKIRKKTILNFSRAKLTRQDVENIHQILQNLEIKYEVVFE